MPRRRRRVCCLLPGIALRGYVPVRIVGLLPDGAIHLHIDDGVYQRTSVAVQQAIVAIKINSSSERVQLLVLRGTPVMR